MLHVKQTSFPNCAKGISTPKYFPGFFLMIVGNGLLAKVFSHMYADRSDVTIFAAGVSNSTETRNVAFERERKLLLEQLEGPCSKFVYFGSCAVGNPQETKTPYLSHKAAMESIALKSGKAVVLRLPQVVARSDNPTR